MVAVSSMAQRYWQGILEEANLILNLEQTDSSWILYSPMQSSQPFVATECNLKNDTLHLSLKELGVSLTLRMAPNQLQGRFKQGLLRANITFSPVEELYVMRRPQTPQPPFPYDTQSVEITYNDVTLTGELTLPKEKRPCPAVLLINGSGQQNRDSEIMGHKPFLVLADYLSRQGIAVLRYDDRGVGGSKGTLDSATTLDFALDAEQLFCWLQKHPRVNPKKVAILGHSEGALIASIIASRNPQVAALLMMGGQGYNGAETLLQQNKVLFQLQGIDSALIQIRLDYLQALFSGQEPSLEKVNALSKNDRKAIGLTKGNLVQLQQQLDIPWMKTFLALDPAQYLPQVKCPILAMGGDKDCQVIAALNLPRIKELNPRAQTITFPQHNHLMQHCETGSVSEYQTIEETLSPEVMQQILKMLHSL